MPGNKDQNQTTDSSSANKSSPKKARNSPEKTLSDAKRQRTNYETYKSIQQNLQQSTMPLPNPAMFSGSKSSIAQKSRKPKKTSTSKLTKVNQLHLDQNNNNNNQPITSTTKKYLNVNTPTHSTIVASSSTASQQQSQKASIPKSILPKYIDLENFPMIRETLRDFIKDRTSSDKIGTILKNLNLLKMNEAYTIEILIDCSKRSKPDYLEPIWKNYIPFFSDNENALKNLMQKISEEKNKEIIEKVIIKEVIKANTMFDRIRSLDEIPYNNFLKIAREIIEDATDKEIYSAFIKEFFQNKNDITDMMVPSVNPNPNDVTNTTVPSVNPNPKKFSQNKNDITNMIASSANSNTKDNIIVTSLENLVKNKKIPTDKIIFPEGPVFGFSSFFNSGNPNKTETPNKKTIKRVKKDKKNSSNKQTQVESLEQAITTPSKKQTQVESLEQDKTKLSNENNNENAEDDIEVAAEWLNSFKNK